MKKNKCAICNASMGKRGCRERNYNLICPKCCAEIRFYACEGCYYFHSSEQYHAERQHSSKVPEFFLESEEEIESAVENALKKIEKGNIADGLKTLEMLNSEYPGHYGILYGIGIAHTVQGMYEDAITYFDKALEIFPYFSQAYYNKAVAQMRKRDIAHALKTLKKLVSACHKDDETVKKARRLLTNYERGILKSKGINLNTFLKYEEKFQQAISYMNSKQWKKAIQLFRECISTLKEHAQSWGNLGLCYAYIGEKELALSAIDKAIEIDPKYDLAIANRKIIIELGEGEKLDDTTFETIDYYKDFASKNESYLQTIFGQS